MPSGDEYIPPSSTYGGRTAKVSRLLAESGQESVELKDAANTVQRLLLEVSENLYEQLSKEIVEEFFPPVVNVVANPYSAGYVLVMVSVSARVYI